MACGFPVRRAERASIREVDGSHAYVYRAGTLEKKFRIWTCMHMFRRIMRIVYLSVCVYIYICIYTHYYKLILSRCHLEGPGQQIAVEDHIQQYLALLFHVCTVKSFFMQSPKVLRV